VAVAVVLSGFVDWNRTPRSERTGSFLLVMDIIMFVNKQYIDSV
jgi:hypothetical protein